MVSGPAGVRLVVLALAQFLDGQEGEVLAQLLFAAEVEVDRTGEGIPLAGHGLPLAVVLRVVRRERAQEEKAGGLQEGAERPPEARPLLRPEKLIEVRGEDDVECRARPLSHLTFDLVEAGAAELDGRPRLRRPGGARVAAAAVAPAAPASTAPRAEVRAAAIPSAERIGA